MDPRPSVFLLENRVGSTFVGAFCKGLEVFGAVSARSPGRRDDTLRDILDNPGLVSVVYLLSSWLQDVVME